jgi:hypothetical protein
MSLRPPDTGPDYVGPADPADQVVSAEPAAEPEASRKPWLLRRLPWPWRVVTSLAAFAAGWLVVAALTSGWPFNSHPAAGAESVLARDGYTGSISISGSLLQQQLQSGGQDTQALKPLISAASVGFKGSSDEIVYTLTPTGQQALPAMMPAIRTSLGRRAPGVTMHLADGNRYWVVDGPASTLGNPSDFQAS